MLGCVMSFSFDAHADILNMAKSKEQREAIKWFYARDVFFQNQKIGRLGGLGLG